MTLRMRLLLGYGYLVGLILLAAGSAMLGFLHLSAGIDLILEDNFKSIRAAMDMIDALERQDSATLRVLIDPDADTTELAGFEQTFRAALARAEANVTEQEERTVLASIDERFADYQRRRDELIGERPERPLASYNERLVPEFFAVKRSVLDLLDINQQAMVRADRDARESALRNGAWLGFLVTLALVSLVFLSRGMQRQILARLTRLHRGMADISEGALERRLQEEGNDELAVIAHQVNRVLDRHQQLAARMQGRVAQERQLALGLVRMLGPGAAVYGLDGELLVGSLDGDGSTRSAVVEWIRRPGRERIDAADDLAALTAEVGRPEGLGVELRLLATADGRPVGWFAHAIAAAARHRPAATAS